MFDIIELASLHIILREQFSLILAEEHWFSYLVLKLGKLTIEGQRLSLLDKTPSAPPPPPPTKVKLPIKLYANRLKYE